MFGLDIIGISALIGSAFLVAVFFILAFRKSDTTEMNKDVEEDDNKMSRHNPKQM